MANTKHIYPFEACFFGVGTAGFNNLCSHCQHPPEYMVVQKVSKKYRVRALCQEHAAKSVCKVSGEIVWHLQERLSDKVKEKS